MRKEIVRIASAACVKAGQKCTAIRRAFVPNAHMEAATAALRDRLSKIVIGNPALDSVRMGPVVGLEQRADVLQQLRRLQRKAKLVIGDWEDVQVEGADKKTGAFLPPMVLLCKDPASASEVHAIEAFGPVSTLMGYGDVGEVIALAHRGGGSLVASVYTYDLPTASDIAFGTACNPSVCPEQERLLRCGRRSARLLDHVRGLFCDHDRRRIDMATSNRWHDRRIYNS